jgi:cyanate permease
MVAVSSLSLALMLMFISVTDQLSGLFGGGPFFSFVFIMLGYFGVRFFGQGVLTSASRNVLLLWFEKRRGLVSSARGVFVSFGFSLAPLALAWLIAVNDWRWAIWVLAGCCAGFSVFAYLFLRDDPTTCGVMVDGHSEDDAPAVAIAVINFTFAQARRSQLFWVLSLSLGIHSLFGTAVVFHIVSIFSEAGRTSAEAFGYFLPAAIGSTSVNLLVGWLADKRPLKPFLIMMLVSFILGGFGLLNLHSEWGYWLLVIGFGAGGGFWSVISNLGFIRNFGPLHLGEISGLCTAVMVFTSAIGPALFSVGLDVFGTYAAAEWLCIVALIVLLTVAIKVPHDHEQLSRG